MNNNNTTNNSELNYLVTDFSINPKSISNSSIND